MTWNTLSSCLTHTQTQMQTHTHRHRRRHTHTHKRRCRHTRSHACTLTLTCMHARSHTHTHTHTDTHTHAFSNTHTHTHPHTLIIGYLKKTVFEIKLSVERGQAHHWYRCEEISKHSDKSMKDAFSSFVCFHARIKYFPSISGEKMTPKSWRTCTAYHRPALIPDFGVCTILHSNKYTVKRAAGFSPVNVLLNHFWEQ